MIISKNLISNFFHEIDQFSIQQLTETFFKSGIELEKYEEIICPSNLFYGLIENCEEIPNLKKKLWKCKVFIPQKNKIFQIVCGASNVKKNLKVLVFLPGAKILNGTKIIEKAEIYGVLSEGMICGFYELYKSKLLDNFDKDISEIIELPEDWNIYKEVVFSDICLDDVIFLLSIPANRTDLNCAWGLAQELKKHLDFSDDKKENWKLKYTTSIFYLRQILQNNNFFARNNFLELLNLYFYSLFGQAFFLKKDEGEKYSFKFEDKSQIYKNLIVTKGNNFYLKKLIYDFLSKNFNTSCLPNDLYKKIYQVKNRKITLDWSKIFKFFNISFPEKKKIIEILSKAGFIFSDDSLNCVVPPWREDIKDQNDFLSEVSSIFTLESISEKNLPVFYSEDKKNSEILSIERARHFWLDKNFFECNTFNLQKKTDVEKYDIFSFKKFVEVKSPLSFDHHVFRMHALNELKIVVEKNEKSKNYLFPVFEIVETNILDEQDQKVKKYQTLNLVVPVSKDICFLGKKIFSPDLYDLQSFLKRHAYFFNQKIIFKKSKNKCQNLFHSTNLLEIYDSSEELIGFLGVLKSKLSVDLYGAVVKFKFKEALDISVNSYSKFPPSYKDISIDITDSKYSIGEILDLLKNSSAKFLKDLNLIDSYTDEKISSITVSAKFQSFEKTLTSEDIQKDIDILYKEIYRANLKIR